MRASVLMLGMGALALGGTVCASPPLNDTGVVTCFDDSASTGTVSAEVADPEVAGFNEQDCTLGAAAAQARGVLYRIGTSTASGRDYTKISNAGADLPSSATFGPAPGDWGCTRDNVTGLIWELKTNDDGPRDTDYRYTWYNPDMATNGGAVGDMGTDTCNGTLSGNCNTNAFRVAVNLLVGDARLCGQTDWRLPTLHELLSIVDFGRSPAVDLDWFPNTVPSDFSPGCEVTAECDTEYWTASPVTNPLSPTEHVHRVPFRQGTFWPLTPDGAYRVMLVRGGL